MVVEWLYAVSRVFCNCRKPSTQKTCI